jgi:NADPH:quinone reductase-like Zn-dependent oxidoreductase
MKAVQTKQFGSEDQLEMVEAPKPRAAAGQVVVRIAATSFNPFDPNRTSGNYAPGLPFAVSSHPGW